jgi:hypothetical protein
MKEENIPASAARASFGPLLSYRRAEGLIGYSVTLSSWWWEEMGWAG